LTTICTAWKTCAAFLASAMVCLAQANPSVPFSFAVIGDQPYNDFLEPATDSLIRTINSNPDIPWILHLGDIKGGAEPCSDSLIKRRLGQLQRSEKPVVYVPGDNEWTDCHRASNGGYNTQERLRFLRSEAFSTAHSMGAVSFPVRHQTEHAFPEHLMWQQGSTLFISLNVPGSNNDSRNPKALRQRNEAIDAWLGEAERLFESPDESPTETVLAIQGNPIDGSGAGEQDGYATFMKRLVDYINTTQRPLLLVHGDTHRFKWDRPSLKKHAGSAETDALFYRAEGWGHPFINTWVKITVTPGTESPFQVESMTQQAEPNN
jgi:predicted phosphodiesterase